MKSIALLILAIVVVVVLFKFLFKVALGLIGLAAVIYLVYYFAQPSRKQLPK